VTPYLSVSFFLSSLSPKRIFFSLFFFGFWISFFSLQFLFGAEISEAEEEDWKSSCLQRFLGPKIDGGSEMRMLRTELRNKIDSKE